MAVGIAPEVENFIRNNVNSVEGLEVLLFLAANKHQWWTPEEVSRKIMTQPASVATRLADFCARGLVSCDDNDRYRYIPSNTQDMVLRNLDYAYKERKDTVIEIIFSSPPVALATFARAFCLRS